MDRFDMTNVIRFSLVLLLLLSINNYYYWILTNQNQVFTTAG